MYLLARDQCGCQGRNVGERLDLGYDLYVNDGTAERDPDRAVTSTTCNLESGATDPVVAAGLIRLRIADNIPRALLVLLR